MRQETVDRAGVRSFLESIRYPLYYLDFETFTSAVPPYDGIRPYQQIPFQYSFHRQESLGGELLHAEYLGLPGEDPRRPRYPGDGADPRTASDGGKRRGRRLS